MLNIHSAAFKEQASACPFCARDPRDSITTPTLLASWPPAREGGDGELDRESRAALRLQTAVLHTASHNPSIKARSSPYPRLRIADKEFSRPWRGGDDETTTLRVERSVRRPSRDFCTSIKGSFVRWSVRFCIRWNEIEWKPQYFEHDGHTFPFHPRLTNSRPKPLVPRARRCVPVDLVREVQTSPSPCECQTRAGVRVYLRGRSRGCDETRIRSELRRGSP